MLTFTICIPVYPPHFKFLNNLIKNINEFIVTDEFTIEEVIIAASETNNLVIETECKYPISIQSTIKKQNEAENRNRAWTYAKGDWIVWLDADDFYHIEKLLVTYKVISQSSNIDCVLHSYLLLGEDKMDLLKRHIENFSVINADDCFNCSFPKKTWDNKRDINHGGYCILTPFNTPLVHGISTVRTSQHIRFDETLNYGTDTFFCSQIALQKKLVATDAVLMLYTPWIPGYNK